MTDSEPDSNSDGHLDWWPWSDTTAWISAVLLIAVVVSAGIFAVNSIGATPDVGETETVELVSDGEVVSTVTAETAVTDEEMRTGLSEHESLAAGEGMLFFHSESGEQTYIMPDMDFGIDIVFIGSDCTVQTIHSADAPASDETGLEPKHQYSGTAKYVLEVPQGYATERISEGDTLRFAGGCQS